MNPQQFRLAYDLYQSNPGLFSEEEVDQLEKNSDNFGVPFRRSMPQSDFNLVSTVGQLLSGFTSGFSTLSVGDPPENTAEAIARNVGHLAGFVGWLPGPWTIGSIGAKSVGMLAKAGKAAGLVKQTADVSKVAGALTSFRSVPMLAADLTLEGVGRVSKGIVAGRTIKFLEEGAVGAQMLRHAGHLGVASAASTWQEGTEHMMDAFIGGAAIGGIFGGIGNVVNLQKALKSSDPLTISRANSTIRALAGSMVTGMPSTIQDEPLELQVYQYLLGAFFGAKTMPAKEEAALRFMMPYRQAGQTSKLMSPEDLDGFGKLRPEVQQEVEHQADLLAGSWVTKNKLSRSGAIAAMALRDAGLDIDMNAIRRRIVGQDFRLASFNAEKGEISLDRDMIRADYEANHPYLRGELGPSSEQKKIMLNNMDIKLKDLRKFFEERGGETAYENFIMLHEEGHQALGHASKYPKTEKGLDLFADKALKLEQEATEYALKKMNHPDYVDKEFKIGVVTPAGIKTKDFRTMTEGKKEAAVQGDKSAQAEWAVEEVSEFYSAVEGGNISEIREEAMGLLRLTQHWPDNADVRLTVRKVIKNINKVFPTKESFNEAFDKWKAAKVKKGQAQEGVYVEDLKKTLVDLKKTLVEPKISMPMHFKDGTGGRKMRPEFRGKSTMDLILSGDRTATSRSPKAQEDVKKGDVIRFHDKEGNEVLVQATTDLYPLKEVTAEKWSKLEGWDAERFESLKKDGYKQFQFELIDKPVVEPSIPKEPMLEPPTSEKSESVQTSEVINEHDSTLHLARPLDMIVEQIVAGTDPNIPNRGRIKERVGEIAKSNLSTGGKEGWNSFLADISSEFSVAIDRNTRMYQGLRSYWVRTAENTRLNEGHFVRSDDPLLLEKSGDLDGAGKNVLKMTPDSFLDKVFGRQWKWIVERFENKTEVVNPDRDRSVVQSIFDMDMGSGEIAEVFAAAAAKGRYFFAGVKDQDKQIYAELVQGRPGDNFVNIAKQYMTSIYRANPKVDALSDYNKHMNVFSSFMKKVGMSAEEAEALYAHMVVSNIHARLTMEKIKDISVIAKNPDKFLSDPVSLNKRMQILNSGEPSLDINMYQDHIPDLGVSVDGRPAMNIVIANAAPSSVGNYVAGKKNIMMKRYRQGKGGKLTKAVENFLAEHHLDGVFSVRADFFDRMIEDGGLPVKGNMLKGFMHSSEVDRGIILGKYAYFRAGKSESAHMAGMPDPVHGILYNTAVPQLGMRKKYDWKLHRRGKDKYEMRYYNESTGKYVKTPETYKIPLEDVTLNLQVYDNPTFGGAMKEVMAVRQMLTNLFAEQVDPKIIDRIYTDILLTSVRGDPVNNKRAHKFLELEAAGKNVTSKDIAKLEKLVENIDVDKLDHNIIMAIVTGGKEGKTTVSDSPLYRKLWDHMLKLGKRGLLDQDSETIVEFDVAQRVAEQKMLDEFYSSADRILQIGGRSPSMIEFKPTKKLTDTVLRNYLVNKAIRPIMPSSGKAFLNPFDPWLMRRLDLKPGEFYFNDALKKFKITYEGKTMSLESAWKHYQGVRKDLEKRDPAKLADLEEQLTFGIIRVPSDSISGMRSLKFKGFTGRQGAGMIIHNEDMIASGGADLDSDSAFFYHGLDRGFMKAIKNNRNEWVDKRGVVRDVKTNLKDFSIKELRKEQKGVPGMFDPLTLWEVSMGSRAGNKLLGVAANARRRIHSLFSFVNSNKGGEWVEELSPETLASINLRRMKGKKNPIKADKLYVKWQAAKDNGEEFRYYARDALNFAADAGDYAGMLSRHELIDLLISKAFKGAIVYDSNGKVYGNILSNKAMAGVYDTIYGRLTRMDNLIASRNWDEGRAWSMNDISDRLSTEVKYLTDRDVEIPGVWGRVVSEELVNILQVSDEYQRGRHFFNNKEYQKFGRKFNRILDENPDVLSMLFREKIITQEKFWDKKEFKTLMSTPEGRAKLRDFVSQDSADRTSVLVVSGAYRKAFSEYGEDIESFHVVAEGILNQAQAHKMSYYNNINVKRAVALHERVNMPAYVTNSELRMKMREYRDGLPKAQQELYDAFLLSSLRRHPFSVTDMHKKVSLHEKNIQTLIKNRDLLEGGTKDYQKDYETITKNMNREQDKISSLKADYHNSGLDAFAFGTDVLPRTSVKKWLDTYRGLHELTGRELSDAEMQRVILRSDPLESPALDRAVPRTSDTNQANKLAEYAEHFWRNHIKDAEHVDVSKMSQEERQLYSDLQDIVQMYPQLRENFQEMFEGTLMNFGVFGTSPRIATKQDLRVFINSFKGFTPKNALRSFIKTGKMPDGTPVKWWHFMMWPESIGRRNLGYDMSPFWMEGPVVTPSGPVFKQVAVPMSHFGRMHQFWTTADKWKQVEINRIVHRTSPENEPMKYEEGLQDLASVREPLDTIKDIDQSRFMDNIIAYKERERGKDAFENDQHRVYEKEWERAEKIWKEEFAGKEYTITLEGEQRRITAEELREVMNDRITGWFESFYKVHVSNKEFAEKEFVWNKTKHGKEIDIGKTLRKLAREQDVGAKPYIIPLEQQLELSFDIILNEMRVDMLNIKNNEIIDIATRLNKEGVKSTSGRTLDWREDIVDVKEMPTELRIKFKEMWKGGEETRITGKGNITVAADDGSVSQNPGFRGIGQVTFSEFFPHGGWGKKVSKRVLQERLERLAKEGADETQLAEAEYRHKIIMAEEKLNDLGLGEAHAEAMMSDEISERDFSLLGLHSRPGHVLRRGSREDGPLPGWQRNWDALERYASQIITARYNSLASAISYRLVKRFENTQAMGKHTRQWARFMKLYNRDNLGYGSTFPRAFLTDVDKLPVKITPYYWFSDEAFEKEVVGRIAKKYFDGNRGLAKEKSRLLHRQLAHLSNLEAKWEMLTLLAHSKSLANNMYGGSTNTIINAGFAPWKNSLSIKYLANYVNPKFKTSQDWSDWTESVGAVESWIVSEARLTGAWKDPKLRKSIREALQQIRKDPESNDLTVFEIFQRNGVTKEIFNKAAWFMRVSERKLRKQAFLAHYINARDALEANGFVMDFEHPWLIKMANQGVYGTQFLYNNANRPAFARTNLGRIFARFQLWSWNSIRFRKELIRRAKIVGYDPGTPEYKRLQSMVTADLFMYALATIFPASMFEATLPQPYQYFEDLADWFFGSEPEKERAFFGMGPAQMFAPPVARYALAPIKSMLSKDWDRFASYHVWTWFPFGRIARDMFKPEHGLIYNPVMATERLVGVPLHQFQRGATKYFRREKPITATETPYPMSTETKYPSIY